MSLSYHKHIHNSSKFCLTSLCFILCNHHLPCSFPLMRKRACTAASPFVGNMFPFWSCVHSSHLSCGSFPPVCFRDDFIIKAHPLVAVCADIFLGLPFVNPFQDVSPHCLRRIVYRSGCAVSSASSWVFSLSMLFFIHCRICSSFLFPKYMFHRKVKNWSRIRHYCNSSAFGFAVTESSPFKVCLWQRAGFSGWIYSFLRTLQ